MRGGTSTISWSANYVDNLAVTPCLAERRNLGFVDISATGTKITFSSGNDGYAKITLPADFTATFFGKPYTSMTVSTDGWFSTTRRRTSRRRPPRRRSSPRSGTT